jgi:predicted S18 family serine protease
MAKIVAAFTIAVMLFLVSSASAYVTSIHVPSVIVNANIGNLSTVQLNVTPGTGGVQINGPSEVQSDTLASAETAAAYAASYLGLRETSYNFNYTIEDKDVNVSGPSGGLAFTLLAVAALQHRQLAQNFAATGTIQSSGSIGLIGGIFDKSGAAGFEGMKYILVPAASNSSFEGLLYYISQQEHKLPLVEVSNVSDALNYAFGNVAPNPVSINLTESYNTASLANTNITCSACNLSAFAELTNATFGLAQGTILNISNNFSTAKQQLLSNLNEYERLVPKGYLYTAADFSFLDYLDSFTLANAGSFNNTGAASLLANVSSYCSSLVPPPLTDTNYEFVIGGRTRQYWANITLNDSETLLANEQTTDDDIQAIRTAASAMGWCSAASNMYEIAATLGGNYVGTSPSLKTAAAAAINKARNSGSGLYMQAAAQAYNSGDYAEALYSATYLSVFGPSLPSNMSTSQIYSQTLNNLSNLTVGIWPSQFGSQSEFYLRQYQLSSGASAKSYLDQAYSTSQLASGLAVANAEINRSFVASISTGGPLSMPQQVEQQISSMQQSITQVYAILLLNAILLFLVLVVLLVHVLNSHKPAVRERRRR